MDNKKLTIYVYSPDVASMLVCLATEKKPKRFLLLTRDEPPEIPGYEVYNALSDLTLWEKIRLFWRLWRNV
jgi:hypothetical protein